MNQSISRRSVVCSRASASSLAIAIAVGFTAPGQAAAQESDGAQQEREVVTVTATRVEADIQEVPLAVNVLSEELLDDLRVDDIEDALVVSPGAYSLGGSADQSSISIRGISADLFGASSDASALTMVDNTVISRSWMRTSAVFDLARVEVSRGPQGTTFGRNATAGVIHFINQRPQFEDQTELQVDVGNYNHLETTAVLNRQVGDSFAFRASGYAMSRDGYFTEETSGDSLDDTDTWGLRLQGLVQPTDRFGVLFRANYLRQNIDVANPAELLDTSTPVFYLGGLEYSALNDDPRSVGAIKDGQVFRRKTWDIGLEAAYELDFGRISYMANYRQGDIVTARDLWGTTLPLLRQKSKEEGVVVQHELRIDNSTTDNPFQWLAGYFALKEDTGRFEEKNTLTGMPAPLRTYHHYRQENQTDSYGIFFNGSYELPTATTISLGARYSDDQKEYAVPFATCGGEPNPTGDALIAMTSPTSAICPFVIPSYAPPTNFRGIVSGENQASWNNISYRASVSQAIGSNLDAYISYATGYKSGGFPNEPTDSSPGSFLPYGEEKVGTLEAGLKGALFSRALVFDVAAYDTAYEDIQAEIILDTIGTNIVYSAGDATIRGVEASGSWFVTDNLDVTANFAYIDASYDSPGVVNPNGDILDGDIPGIPNWTAFLAASYLVPLDSGADLRFHANVRSRDERLSDDNPAISNPGDEVFGASITWTSPSGNIEAGLWGRNLTNEDDFRQVSGPTALSANNGIKRAGPPRTYGVSLTWRS